MSEYRRLDLDKLNYRIKEIISMEEALKNVSPFEIPEDVLSGEKKLVVTKAEKDIENRCVKLEISY